MSEEKKYYTFPEGSYELEIVGQALSETKPKDGSQGKPYLALNTKVIAAKKLNSQPKEPVQLGKNRSISLYFTEKTIENTKKFLQAAGFKGKSLAQLDPNHPQFENLSGFRFDASCKHDSYDGKTRDKFSAYPIGGGGNGWMSKLPTANTSKLMQLDAIFGSVKVDGAVLAAPAKVAAKDDVPWSPVDDSEGW